MHQERSTGVRRAAWVTALGAAALLAALWRKDIPLGTLEARYGIATSRFVAMPDGLRLHYLDAGPRDGPVLLLVHGYSASSFDWMPWIEHLARRHRVIAIDLPGHGLTAAKPGAVFTVDGLIAIVAALVAALHLPRFLLVGHSMGGQVAWHYALDHAARIAGLVLVGATGWADERPGPPPLVFRLLASAPGRWALRHLNLAPLVRRGLRNAVTDAALVTPALVRRTTDLVLGAGHRRILTELQVRGGDASRLSGLAAVAVPTLIMAGEADRLVPLDHARRFAAAIPGASLVTYPGIGHMPMQEIPERSAADLEAWIAAFGDGL